MRWFAALLFAAALTAGAESALACTCPPPPPAKEAMEKSAAVFLAKVVEVKGMEVTLEVARTWKGVTTKTAVLTTFSGARCGYDFHVGRSYLVYAFRNDKGVLTTNFCTRTMPEASAKADLEALGPGQAPEGK